MGSCLLMFFGIEIIHKMDHDDLMAIMKDMDTGVRSTSVCDIMLVLLVTRIGCALELALQAAWNLW